VLAFLLSDWTKNCFKMNISYINIVLLVFEGVNFSDASRRGRNRLIRKTLPD
jgi:hypothetical protein